ncbi:MAG: hypothetical protein O2887_11270 [Bacteroidetes bacterium]|nr:hypothetical protein [Bacteroidota bacterium]MDA1121052.1 hypothetical protein [Bacteroidota bacterium]
MKIVFAVAAGFIYKIYYGGGDTLTFYKGAISLNQYLNDGLFVYLNHLIDPINYGNLTEPRTEFFIRMVSVVSLFSFENYWIISIYFSVLSFLCCWVLFVDLIKDKDFFKPAIMATLLLPSVLFWSSGLLKETVALMGIMMICWALIPFINKKRIPTFRVVLAVIGFYIIYSLKYYYAATIALVLFPLIVSLIVKRSFPKKQIVRVYGVYLISFLAPLAVINYMHYNFHYSRILTVIVDNFLLYGQNSESFNQISYNGLEPTLASIGINFPYAVFGALFRPLPWESWNFISFLISMENLILLALFIYSLYHWKHFLKYDSLILITALIFVIITSGALALSTPNFGTLSRYTSLLKPILVLVIMHYGNVYQELSHQLRRF